jgi:hypothetical protein
VKPTNIGSYTTKRGAALLLLCWGTLACEGTVYAIPPAQASQLDDADWVIKHAPAPAQPVASPNNAEPPAPEPALSDAETKP